MGIIICWNRKIYQSTGEYTLHLSFQAIEIISNLVNCVCTSMHECVCVCISAYICLCGYWTHACRCGGGGTPWSRDLNSDLGVYTASSSSTKPSPKLDKSHFELNYHGPSRGDFVFLLLCQPLSSFTLDEAKWAPRPSFWSGHYASSPGTLLPHPSFRIPYVYSV